MRANEPLSAVSHLFGVLLSIAGLVLLLVFSVLRSSSLHVVVFSVFGASLVLLFLASTIYHFLSSPRAKEVFRRIDHSLIFVLIAGTYTPLCFLVLKGFFGWFLFGVIWFLAVLGVVVKSVNLPLPSFLSTIIYLLMGWLVVVAFVPLLDVLSFGAVFWLVSGGVAYTVGSLFYFFEERFPRRRLFDLHEWFHLFVLLGAFCHFWLMFRYVLFL